MLCRVQEERRGGEWKERIRNGALLFYYQDSGRVYSVPLENATSGEDLEQLEDE